MPTGINASKCIKCGKEFICGDCIIDKCPPCEMEEITLEIVNEQDSVRNLISRAKKEGLLIEVIISLAKSNHGSVIEKCHHALSDWDI